MQKYRIEGLSDLVFGLALSIGSLAMINQPVTDVEDVENGIIGFVFSFLVIVSVWLSYTRLISEKKIETTKDLRLNLALLMLVAIEPYLLYLLGQSNPAILDFSSTAYAIDIGVMMLIMAGLYGKNVSPGTVGDEGDHEVSHRLRYSTVGLIFLVSALPFFWQPSFVFGINLRFVVWMFAVVPGTVSRWINRRKRADFLDTNGVKT
jgi:uncharacterized membrane protein